MSAHPELQRIDEWPRLTPEQAQHTLHAWMTMAELVATSAHALDLYDYLNRRFTSGMQSDGWVVAQLNSTRDDLTFAHSGGDHALSAQRITRALMKPLADRLARTSSVLLLQQNDLAAMLSAPGRDLPPGGLPQNAYVVAVKDESGISAMLAVCGIRQPLAMRTEDPLLLRFAAHHVSVVVARKRTQDALKVMGAELDRRVIERTKLLAEANAELRRQAEERELIENRLKHDALHDALTGLPNRVLMRDRLENALARYRRDNTQTFAVLYLDLDRFKVINDSMGHAVGDDLLIEVGRRIVASLREVDTIARLGGDEFAVLLPGVHTLQDVAIVANRLIHALSQPVYAQGKELFTSTSIGVALSHTRYKVPDDLLRDADAAMYLAKSKGRKRYEVFDETLHEKALRLLDLEGELRRALGQSEFVPFYQAIVDLRDGGVQGYEALLRWRHPQRGWMSPGEFLDVAQEIGLSEQIDMEIYERVCADLIGFPDDLYVSVNLSPRHFRDRDLPARLIEMVERHGVSTDRLRLEVTEGSLLENPAEARRMLEELRTLGLVALLDDFGTGYSSLSYLHQFPMHALKIDRSFVSGLTDPAGNSQAVVEAVLSLAQSLGVEVIAEGIETEHQCQTLLSLGCTQGQGFLFSKPRQVEAVLFELLTRP
ncbi:MAG: EAL domain-containing protein [Pseudomonadota bacterium]|nr:EAL domain-containing protein [Pseudomonadota bacterium]